MAKRAYFSHGTSGRPWGEKINALAAIAREHGCEPFSPDHRGLQNPDERALALSGTCSGKPLLLIGTSMGAYASIRASAHLQPVGLFLLTPAFNLAGYAEAWPVPNAGHVSVVHGRQDALIPIEGVIAWCDRVRAELTIVNAGHEINAELPLLEALFRAFLVKTGTA